MPARADGSCVHLAADNTCSIYETRPAVCRVDAAPFVELGFKTRREWHAANERACEALRSM